MLKGATKCVRPFLRLRQGFACLKCQIEGEVDPNVHQSLKRTNYLAPDHTPFDTEDVDNMLKVVMTDSLDTLLEETIPGNVRNWEGLKGGPGEHPLPNDILHAQFKKMMDKNKQFTCFIGEGFYGTIVPPVIERNFISNPGWYTAYTPYQAEISQGRMTGLAIYQDMIRELTGMDVSGSSLLDEASSAAESMILSWNSCNRKCTKYLVDETVYNISYKAIQTVADHLGIEVVRCNLSEVTDYEGVFGAVIQNPDRFGRVADLTDIISKVKAEKPTALVSVACDLASLMLVKTPGQMGADIAFGNSQRFGVPMGYGGPAAAFFATKKSLLRLIPGRIIAYSRDSQGNRALRMALQTREQHIRREKATSNICTAQALLANMAMFYALHHREEGLINISTRINAQAQYLARGLEALGFNLLESTNFFDTVSVIFKDQNQRDSFYDHFLKNEHNLRKIDSNIVSFSCDETKTAGCITKVLELAEEFTGKKIDLKPIQSTNFSFNLPHELRRNEQGRIFKHEIFHQIKGEHELMRFMKYLENLDISLTKSMIPLGSCTMKLNSAVEMIPLTWPQMNVHPYVPMDQAEGYKAMIDELGDYLKLVTGFDGVSFNSNSGASGEYAGILSIRNYQRSKGELNRNICLIPSSAHGTNPASAIKCGLDVKIIAADRHGNIDLKDLEEKCKLYQDNLCCLMVTYPSTHGVYEDTIRRATELIHEHGGQVYLDGANMNAQVGLTSPGFIGADVCHLNLHKTFCIPHGGGGPGMGPICVRQHLVPFLPSTKEGAQTGPISSAEYASASILSISYLYMKALGNKDLTNATTIAILNANYMASRLRSHYTILYSNQKGRVAHEFIMDIRDIKKASGISEEDVAKRLVDYGFHAPTMSFPVAGTLMIEPTESENKEELDRLCEALISIRQEIAKVQSGEYDKLDNPLKNAPHTADMVTSDNWTHKYTRQEAAYPLPWVKARGKYWPPVSRIDNVYGDKNIDLSLPNSKFFF